MSNDLQDRIAGVLTGHPIGGVLTGHPIGGGYYGTTVGRDEALSMADEVIEDLGLVVETTVRVVDHGAGPLRIPESRVVGKWER